MKLKHPFRLIAGVCLCLLSLWLGAYALHFATGSLDWIAFPSFVSAFVSFLVGVVLSVTSFNSADL